MKKSTKLALAFLAFAGLAGSQAIAEEQRGERMQRGDRFERLDADKSGDISFEEFSARFQERIGSADADGDGKITVEEMADHILRQRAERQARRMIERFDVNGDGALALDEIESRHKKRFAMMDRNDDGVLQKDELRRSRKGERGGWRHHGKREHRGQR